MERKFVIVGKFMLNSTRFTCLKPK